MNAEEQRMELHAKTLSALDSGDPEEIEQITWVLRRFVDAWEDGAEHRETMRDVLE